MRHDREPVLRPRLSRSNGRLSCDRRIGTRAETAIWQAARSRSPRTEFPIRQPASTQLRRLRRHAPNGPVPGPEALRWYERLLAPPRFEPAVEADYIQGWRLPQALALQRLAGWMAVAMYVSALTFDALFAQRLPGPELIWAFGTLGAGMGLLLTFAASHPRLIPHAHHFAFFTLLVNGCVLIAAIAYTRHLGQPFPHAWMLVVLIYTFVMTSMPYRHAATLGVVIVLLDNAVGVALAFPPAVLSDRALFDVSMLVTGLIASSTFERSDRLSWQRAKLLLSKSYSDELTGLRNRRYLFEEGTPDAKTCRSRC